MTIAGHEKVGLRLHGGRDDHVVLWVERDDANLRQVTNHFSTCNETLDEEVDSPIRLGVVAANPFHFGPQRTPSFVEDLARDAEPDQLLLGGVEQWRKRHAA